MPPGLENPFHPPHEPTLTDAQAVGKVLGSETQRAMEAVLGEDTLGPREDLPMADISISADERVAIERRNMTKTQIEAWLEAHGLPERAFLVHEEGGVTIVGFNSMRGQALDWFPPEVAVMLNLDLSENKFTTLAAFRNATLFGALNLSHNRLTSLAGIETIRLVEGGSLVLTGNRITSLAGIEGAELNGSLWLADNPLTSLHGLEGKTISGTLDLSRIPALNSLDGLEGATIGGDLYLRGVPAKHFPKHLTVNGAVILLYDQRLLASKAEKRGFRVTSMN